MSSLPAPVSLLQAPQRSTVGLGLATISVSLLDLPPELLLEVLRDVPWSVRPTCRCFRGLLDTDRRVLSLRPSHGASPQRQLQHLTSLLRRLPRLTALHVSSFEFTTLSILPTACPTLESLTLADAQRLSDDALPLLWTCRRLTFLDLSGCGRLNSLRALCALTALRSLDVGGCPRLTSITPVVHCPHITSLTLGIAITCLGPVTALHSLASLTSSNCAIRDFSPLASAAASLTRLHFPQTGTADLYALLTCTRLVSLELESAYYVRNLSPLMLFGRALTRLHLRNAAVVDLSPVATCTSLSTLALSNCRAITSAGALASLGRSLPSLDLSFSPVSDASPMSFLTALCHLDLRGTACASAAPLAACTRLKTLRVAQCPIPADQLLALTQALSHLVVDHAN